MVRVHRTTRKSAVLTPSTLACLSQLPTVNLTAGCAHGCAYCYGRGYRTYPGDGKVTLYTNTLEKLRDELPRKRRRPRAVYFSPSSDAFQPVPEVLDMTFDVFAFLLEAGLGIAFLTKGRIPRRHMRLLLANAPQVRAQIGLVTLDPWVLRCFEPHATPPEVRLDQIAELVRGGVLTQVRLDPILPGLTDDERSLAGLCGALAEAGIQRIAAAVLFLRPTIVHSLRRHVRDHALVADLLARFRTREPLRMRAERSTVLALPRDKRRAIYERLERIAGQYGITVRRCACKNPDLTSESCGIAGEWVQEPTGPRQRHLFEQQERTKP